MLLFSMNGERGLGNGSHLPSPDLVVVISKSCGCVVIHCSEIEMLQLKEMRQNGIVNLRMLWFVVNVLMFT